MSYFPRIQGLSEQPFLDGPLEALGHRKCTRSLFEVTHLGDSKDQTNNSLDST